MWEVTSTIEKLSSGKKLAIAMSADAITTLIALPLSFWILTQTFNTPQVNGRDELSIPDKVKYDEEYLKRRTFLFDLKILWLTLLGVFFSRGVSH